MRGVHVLQEDVDRALQAGARVTWFRHRHLAGLLGRLVGRVLAGLVPSPLVRRVVRGVLARLRLAAHDGDAGGHVGVHRAVDRQVPGLVNVKDTLSPFPKFPESNFSGPLATVTVCGAVSMLFEVTVSPMFTVSDAGE